MYKNFFGLRTNPFNVNPDPNYLLMTQCAVETFATLIYGLHCRKGFILMTGEVGTGKTTLLNKLLEWLRAKSVATAFIFNSSLDAPEFLDFMMADYGLKCESPLKSQRLVLLNHWLLERYRAGLNTVLVVDEAQNLSSVVLEEIRLLTNLETSSHKLLQIVLSGQPELEEKLKQPSLRQLRQRIALRCKTQPLTPDETRRYIARRLHIAGANGSEIFTTEAIDGIYKHTRGIPRIINLVCEHALINAFAADQKNISVQIIEDVSREYEVDNFTVTRDTMATCDPVAGTGT